MSQKSAAGFLSLIISPFSAICFEMVDFHTETEQSRRLADNGYRRGFSDGVIDGLHYRLKKSVFDQKQ